MTSSKSAAFASAVLKAGLIVGTLDILSACLQFFLTTGKSPVVIFPYIASGIFGNAAFNSGSKMILVGLILHYLIAMTFTLVYFLIYPSIRLLAEKPLLAGAVYGLLIWTIMSQLVIPLSAITERPFKLIPALIAAGILMVAIGIPLAYMARRFYRNRLS